MAHCRMKLESERDGVEWMNVDMEGEERGGC